MSLTPALQRDAPTPDEIRAEVNRMVMSDVFIRSPQLGAFLRFVVEAVLHGKGDRIKAYTIGIEVLRRDTKFDPQLDPIVRVEATRLRRAIERYYTGPGADDVVVIDLPRGSYVPIFRRIQIEPQQVEAPVHLVMRLVAAVRKQPVLSALIAVLAVAALVGAGLALRPETPLSAAGLRPGNGMPTLLVQPFDVIGAPVPNAISATALFAKSRDAFARFDAINIVSEPVRADVRVDYRFAGFADYRSDGTTSVAVRLTDVRAGSLVWARTFERRLPDADHAASENNIVFELANALLQPFGIIRSRERTKDIAASAGDARYRCLLLTADAFRTFEPEEHDRARSCLERLIAIDPGFADGFSYLAAVHNREFLYGFGKTADDPNGLDRGLQLARRGIELNPTSARAYQVLSTILFSRRDSAAFTAVERAVALNPYDLIIVGDYGGRLIAAGEIDRGLLLLQRAAGDGGVRPSWHHFHLFLASYLRGDVAEATRQAAAMTSDTYSHGLLARALTAFANGDQDKAQAALDRLVRVAGQPPRRAGEVHFVVRHRGPIDPRSGRCGAARPVLAGADRPAARRPKYLFL